MCNKILNNVLYFIYYILSALILGVGVAAVFYGGLIASITIFLYITLILGILGFLYILIKAFTGGKKQKKSYALISIIGAIVTSIFALTSTGLIAAATTPAILIGAVAFFFATTLFYLTNEVIEKIGYDNYEE